MSAWRHLRPLADHLAGRFGFKLRRLGERDRHLDLLTQARRVGFQPATVVDVGAAYGQFAGECALVFRQARCLLIEPLEEYRSQLNRIIRELPDSMIVAAAAARSAGKLTIHVHADLVGSSTLMECEQTGVNGIPRTVPAVRLDDLIEERNLKGPYLLKIDVQGAELDVLAGAPRVLADTEYALLEVSFFEFFRGGPLFYDVVTAMKDQGFVPYDICGLLYRPLDRALAQADVAFVKEKGLFRSRQEYATAEQRAAQDRLLQKLAPRR